jgi:peptidoglycan/LPS O-acetylase OafA/YrhL
MVLVEHLPLNLYFFHTALYDFLILRWRGAAGVDLFFSISGFVIARSLLPQLRAASAQRRVGRTLGAFWLRRAFRLLPAAWVWIAIPLVLTLLFNRSGAFGGWIANLHSGIASLLNVANFYLAYALGRHEVGIHSPYWSLSLEEQFYVLFPLLALVAGRWLAIPLLALVAYQFVLPLPLIANVTRPGALAAGVLVAMLHESRWREKLRPGWLAERPAAGLICLGLGIGLCGVMLSTSVLGSATFAHRSPDAWRFGIGFGGVAIVAAGLVHIAGYNGDYLIRPGRIRGILVWIGVRSYALYLTHRTAYAAAREILFRFTGNDKPGTVAGALVLLAIALPVLLAITELTHRFIELPGRGAGVRIARRILQEAPLLTRA